MGATWIINSSVSYDAVNNIPSPPLGSFTAFAAILHIPFLIALAQIVGKQIEENRLVVVNVNNHYEGCAVLTIDRLIDLLQ